MSFSSCESEIPGTESPNFDYSIVYEDGEWYFVFDNYAMYNVYFLILADDPNMKTKLNFTSVEECKDKIMTGKLSGLEKVLIAHFPKDESDRIYACDFNDLLDISFKKDKSLVEVIWRGRNDFDFVLEGSDGTKATYCLLSDERYSEKMKDYLEFYERDEIKIKYTNSIENKIRKTYTEGGNKYTRETYEMSKEGERFLVEKIYLGEDFSIPQKVSLISTQENSRKIYIQIEDIKSNLTDEWIMDFEFVKSSK